MRSHAILTGLLLPAAIYAGVIDIRREPEVKIVGGDFVPPGYFNFIVALTQLGEEYCGGTLINANTVLTAGHCSVGVNPADFKARVGSHKYHSGGKAVAIKKILLHPGFNQTNLDNDLALWHLASPIHESPTIKYTTLPAKGNDPVAGTSVTVAGWGDTTDGGESSRQLKQVEIPVVARQQCNKLIGGGVTKNMWCAGDFQGGEDSCQGDSGGPIINTINRQQIGIVSFGFGCAQPKSPGVYTRVGNYVDWINNNSWKDY